MTAIEPSAADSTALDPQLAQAAIDDGGPAATAARRPSATRALIRSPLALSSLIWLILVSAVSLAAPLIAPYGVAETDLANGLAGPSTAHWLGTDQLGRDVLSRLMFGGKDALLGAVEASIVFVVVGVVLGLLAGYYGGWLDWLTTRWAEITVALPGVLLLLVVLAIFPRNQHAAMVSFGFLAAPGLARVIRAETLQVRNELYVSAARIAGLNDLQILSRHVVRRLTTTIIVQAALLASVAIVVQAGLSFLGLGPQDPAPSWGGLINVAGQVLDRQPWLLVPSGGVIALTVLALGLIGDALRDVTVQQWSRSSGPRSGRRPTDRSGNRRASAAARSEASTGAEALLSVRGLSVSFDTPDGPVTVVDDVSFDVDRGETVGIVGESGCGKSVTVAAILGILPGSSVTDAYSCRFDGEDVLTLSERERHKIRGTRIGYVSQEPMTALDPTVRVGDLLAEAVRWHRGVSRKAARARAVELLGLVKLPDPADVARRYPHQISGGMAQRVAIALALAGAPDLLVADEPTTALDVTVQAEVLDLLRQLQADMGLAVILITHDWGVAAQLCSRAMVMYAGQIVEQGSVSALYHRSAHPYTAGLLAANPQRALTAVAAAGSQLTRLPAIPGTVPPPAQWPASCHFQGRCPLVIEECTSRPVHLVAVAPGHASRCIRIDQVRPVLEVTS